MKRALVVVVLTVCGAAPAAAQLAGLPVWNSPKGGTGVGIYADAGFPNEDYGKGTAFAGRGTLGLGNLTIGAGVATWKPDGADESITSFAGQVAFRVIGGSLLPVSINIQGGVGRQGEIEEELVPSVTLLTAAVGLSVNLPTPGLSIEPFVSPGIRYVNTGDLTVGTITQEGEGETNFGAAIGVNVDFGLFGVHAAYDFTNADDAGGESVTPSVFAIGGHLTLRLPAGF